jgi:hypothetical protein
LGSSTGQLNNSVGRHWASEVTTLGQIGAADIAYPSFGTRHVAVLAINFTAFAASADTRACPPIGGHEFHPVHHAIAGQSLLIRWRTVYTSPE